MPASATLQRPLQHSFATPFGSPWIAFPSPILAIILFARHAKTLRQTDLVGFKNSGQIVKSASESVLGASSVPNCRTSVPNCRTPEVVTFTDAVGMLKEARDRVYQRIVAQQLMERVNGASESDSIQRTKSATVRKTCDTSGSSQEASVDLSPLVKRSLAMMQADPLRAPSAPVPCPIQTPVTPLQHHFDERLQHRFRARFSNPPAPTSALPVATASALVRPLSVAHG